MRSRELARVGSSAFSFASIPRAPFGPAAALQPARPCQLFTPRAISVRRFTHSPFLALGVLSLVPSLVSVPGITRGSREAAAAASGSASIRMSASAADKPLSSLLETSKEACDSIGAMVRRFYLAINSDTSTLKADKSVFTIADGIVQELLAEYLYAGAGKFRAIVGEEDSTNTNIVNRPYSVDTLSVPPEFEDLVDDTRNAVAALAARIPDGAFSDLTVFIDPIDGTREFSTGKGSQCSICIGFAGPDGLPVAGLVYRPIPRDECSPSTQNSAAVSPRTAQCSWAAGATSEACVMGNLNAAASAASTSGFLTTNGAISKFTEALMDELKFERVPAGGAGNKMMLLLEGKGAVYIQDRGVSRWDTCGAQAVIEAYGGKLCRLDEFVDKKALTSYTYVKGDSNADFVPGLSNLTPYNAQDAKSVVKGAPLVKADTASQVKAYANLNGLLAVSSAGMPQLDAIHAAISAAKEQSAPSYD